MRRFNETLLSKTGELDVLHPWASKEAKLFGRFTAYERSVPTSRPGVPLKGLARKGMRWAWRCV